MSNEPIPSSVNERKPLQKELQVNNEKLVLQLIQVDPVGSKTQPTAIYFLMSEVSCNQFKAVCPEEYDDILPKLEEDKNFDPSFPAHRLTANEVKTFIDKLNAAKQRPGVSEDTFRLPTLAEWQLASRAGREGEIELVNWEGFGDAIKMLISRKEFNIFFEDLKKSLTDVRPGGRKKIPFPDNIDIVRLESGKEDVRAREGSIHLDDPDEYFYVSPPDFVGLDYVSFSYKFKDYDGWTGSYIIEAKVKNETTHNVTYKSSKPKIKPLENFIGDESDITIGKDPKHGKVVKGLEVGTKKDIPFFTYTPSPGFIGKDEFEFTVKAKAGEEPKTTTVVINVFPPFLKLKTERALENKKRIIDVLGFENTLPDSLTDDERKDFTIEKRLVDFDIELPDPITDTEEGGTVEKVMAHLYVPKSKDANQVAEIKYKNAQNEVGTLLVGQKTSLSFCTPGNDVKISPPVNEKLTYQDGERLSVETSGSDNELFSLKYRAKREDQGLQKVTYSIDRKPRWVYVYVTAEGAAKPKTHFTNVNEPTLLKIDGLTMSYDDYPESSVMKDQGTIFKVPAIKYIPPKDRVTKYERFKYELVSNKTDDRTSIEVGVEVGQNETQLLARKCLRLWGALNGINEYEGKVTVEPGKWLAMAQKFEGTQEQVINDTCLKIKEAALASDKNKKEGIEILVYLLKKSVRVNEDGRVIIFSTDETPEGDTNAWGLRNMHGNAPEFVTSEGQWRLKGNAGIIGSFPKRFLISTEGVEIDREDESDDFRNKRAGFRLVMASRLSEHWFEALRAAATNSDRNTAGVTKDLERKARAVQTLAKIETDTSRTKGADDVGEIAALYQAVAHVRADEPVPANVAEKVVYLGKKTDDPFFEYLGNVMKHRN